ncbi:Glycoside hydrolase [Teratosphaeria destructans]|uniref:Glycoside hydrolase n=1 Tax=Teratosphaeria destructans TaxID=418781 RepID=A0A9W7SN06_9PEZI|nr:Glycoside hydrolase [Teratosphaeria destructans]
MMLRIQGLVIAILAAFTAASSAPGAKLPRNDSIVILSGTAPADAGRPLEAFVSFSIEFSSFPDYAGDRTSPNTFSNNLLNSIGHFAGTKPYIRVGGNTQDYAIFNSSIDVASVGIVNPALSSDYPTTLTIGPKYFESYKTLSGTKFIHGFNLGKNSTSARHALLESVPFACKALEGGNLLHWELGNEPDLFKTSAQGHVRPPNWTEANYVDEWVNLTRAIETAMRNQCPKLASNSSYKYYAPSFAGTSNSLDPLRTWENGLDIDKNIAVISSHNYISGATSPGVTLQGTLMNHSRVVASVAKQLNESRLLAALPQNLKPELPFILGETNSLYNQGRPGLSNTFGAALWGIDFNLWCATNNISRVHMHQGTNYRYQAWQPVETNITSKGTKAPYYASLTVAAFLGNLKDSTPSIVNLPLPSEQESAYAAYVGGELARLIIVNLQGYNATEYNSAYINNYTRPVEQYTFQLPSCMVGSVNLRRLMANGSDAITGVTFDGYSYNYDLGNGLPVLLKNVTRGETAIVGQDGRLKVGVPRSSAVIVDFGDALRNSSGRSWGW